MTFGEYLKSCRDVKGDSLRKVSKATGVALGLLSDMETGKMTNPTADTFKKLCKHYRLNKRETIRLLYLAR